MMKQINSFLGHFIFGLPLLFCISILLWIMLLFRPEETKQALTEMTKNLEENIYF